jgi:hypothetical protein
MLKAGSTYISDMAKPIKRFHPFQKSMEGTAFLYGDDESVILHGIEVTSSVLFLNTPYYAFEIFTMNEISRNWT